MCEVDALEVVTHPREVAQSFVVDAPVGQHLEDRGEDVERTAACVGIEEGWHHDVGAVLVDGTVLRIERAAHACSPRIVYALVSGFYALLVDVQVFLELLEGAAVVSVACRARACKGCADADGGHVERTAEGGRCSVHVLDALVAVVGVTHVDVNLQVGEGLERYLHLHVLGLSCRSRCGYAIAADEPAAALGLVQIGVIHEAECKVNARREHAVHALLSQKVAHLGQEARNSEVVCVAIADRDVAHHHQEARSRLCQAVPLLFRCLGQSHDVQAHLGGIDWCLDELDGVLVHLLELDVVGKAATVACGDTDALGLLSVSNDEVGIREERYLLDEALVLRLLLRADASSIALLGGQFLPCQDAIYRFTGLHRFLLCLLAGILLFLLRILLGLVLPFLLLSLLVGSSTCIGGREALVGFLEEGTVVVELLQIEAAIDVHGALRVDGVAERRTASPLCSTLPRVVGIVGDIGRSPVKNRYLLEGHLVADLYALAVVEGSSEVAQAPLHRVLPGFIAVGVEVFVDLRVWFFYLSPRPALEGEVQSFEDVPLEREVTVPRPVLAEGGRQGREVARVLKVTLLQLVVVAVHVRREGDALRPQGYVLSFDDVEPLALAFEVLEWLNGLPVRAPRIVDVGLPVQLALIDGGLSFLELRGAAVTEGEVSGVIGHRVLA